MFILPNIYFTNLYSTFDSIQCSDLWSQLRILQNNVTVGFRICTVEHFFSALLLKPYNFAEKSYFPNISLVCSILVWIAFHFWWISNKLIGIRFHLSSFPWSVQSLTWKPSLSLGRHSARSLWPHTWVCTTCKTCTTSTTCKTCTNCTTCTTCTLERVDARSRFQINTAELVI